jgi:S-adenosylmethionine decarboxylase
MYDFRGIHYLASYMGCNNARMLDIESLKTSLKEAVACSGASILSTNDYIFESGGYTAVFLLSESHASIHTYPEHNKCFVDLFTCGDKCSYKPFAEALRVYLEAEKVESQVIDRGDSTPIVGTVT